MVTGVQWWRRGLAGRLGRATACVVGLTLAGALSRPASAAPGVADRLGGIEAQGPASRSVTALHHNPAMLAAMRSTALHVAMSVAIAQLRIRRNAIDGTTGAPESGLQDPTNLLNLSPGWFVGGTLYLDPWAVGIGVYDLSSRYQLASADPFRYHLSPDPDASCLDLRLSACPPNGGRVSYRHDTTVALAYNGGLFQLGAAAHFPMVRERFAFDTDSELLRRPGDTPVVECQDKEDPACAERVGFKGYTQWLPRNGAPAGFDVAVSVGMAVSLANDRVTIGARYRTFPLRRGGEVQLGGVGVVCRPEVSGVDAGGDGLPPCTSPEPVNATLRQRLPQQFSVGASALLGATRQWRVDANLFWADLCPGGLRAGSCADDGNQQLRLVGLARRGVALSEQTLYRGLADMYGADVFARLRPNLAEAGLPRTLSRLYVLMAGHLRSPGVQRGATSAASSEGWRIGGSVGTRLKLRRTELAFVPGYGLDVELPRRVDPGSARFDPLAATGFTNSDGDLNSSGADAVLAGRGRPTNAGRYLGLVHTLSLSILWGEPGATLE
jgi:hypothetical protein